MRLLRPLFSPFKFIKPSRPVLLLRPLLDVRHYAARPTAGVQRAKPKGSAVQTHQAIQATAEDTPEFDDVTGDSDNVTREFDDVARELDDIGAKSDDSAPGYSDDASAENARRTLKVMNRFMLDRQPGLAVKIFQETMQERFHGPIRARLFVGTINIFLRRGFMREAMQIYSYMTAEGFVPEPKLKATMSVLRYIASNMSGTVVHMSTIVQAVQPVFADKAFDEACLRFLMFKLYQLFKIKVPAVVQIMEAYFQARPTETKLTPATISTLKFICARLSMPEEPPEPDYNLNLGPVVDAKELLVFAQHTRAGPRTSSTLLRKVFKDAAPDSLGVRNLLAFFAKNRCYDWASEMYRILAGMNDNAYDWQTFGVMFNIVRIFSRARSIRQRGLRKPVGLPSLHDLFRDMLASHLAYTRNRPKEISAVLNGALLCRALHAFVWQEDYAAAFIVLNTFKHCGLPVTIDAYRNALGGLVDRLQLEIPFIDPQRTPKYWFAYRFLGCPDPGNMPTGLDLVNAVLTVGEDSRINLDPIPLKEPVAPEREDQLDIADGLAKKTSTSDTSNPESPSGTPRRRRYHAVPTAFELLGVAPARKEEYSVIPLQQILRSAMLAIPREYFVLPSTYTSMLVREVKKVMIPKIEMEKGQDKPRRATSSRRG